MEETGGEIAGREAGPGGDVGRGQDLVVGQGEEGEGQEAGGRVQAHPAALHLLRVHQTVEGFGGQAWARREG